MLLHTEYSLLSLLKDQEGVVHHHGLFKVRTREGGGNTIQGGKNTLQLTKSGLRLKKKGGGIYNCHLAMKKVYVYIKNHDLKRKC